MSVAVMPTPIIPVIDERLFFPVDATKEHKVKVNSYNDLLEDIFIRELELSKLKASLVDMRHEIVEEAQTLDKSGMVIQPRKEEQEGSQEADEGTDEASDSTSSDKVQDKEKKDKKRRSKGKFNKGRGKDKSKIAESQMDADWDYNLDLAGSKRARRASDASVTEAAPIQAMRITSKGPNTGSH